MCHCKPSRKCSAAARILTRTRGIDDIPQILINIHWLALPLRVQYKVSLLTFKCLHDLGPAYLKKLLTPYKQEINLRSTEKELLEEQNFKLKTYGLRAFCVVAPKLWNRLPNDLRFTHDLPSFKSQLKTHLFKLFTDCPSLYVY